MSYQLLSAYYSFSIHFFYITSSCVFPLIERSLMLRLSRCLQSRKSLTAMSLKCAIPHEKQAIIRPAWWIYKHEQAGAFRELTKNTHNDSKEIEDNKADVIQSTFSCKLVQCWGYWSKKTEACVHFYRRVKNIIIITLQSLWTHYKKWNQSHC